jgi:hypothetical protein
MGLKWFGKKEQDKEPEPEPEENTIAVGMVALSSPRAPAPETVAQLLRDKHEGITPPINARMESKDGGELLTVRMGPVEGAAIFIPVPIPWPDLEGPCETAWWWPEATEMMRSHSAHAIVTLIPGGDDIFFNSLMVTKLAAAVAEAGDGVGVYWGAGTVVHPVTDFAEHAAAATLDDLPLNLWVDFRVQRISETHTRLLTTGMESLNGPELEIAPVPVEPLELLDFAVGVADYVLTSGAQFKSGQTIGRTEDEKYRISFTRSMWERPGKVMRLEL